MTPPDGASTLGPPPPDAPPAPPEALPSPAEGADVEEEAPKLSPLQEAEQAMQAAEFHLFYETRQGTDEYTQARKALADAKDKVRKARVARAF
jgi:hypothetical protein